MVVLVIVIISVPHTWEMKKIWMLLYIFQEDFSFNDFFIIIFFLKKSSFFAAQLSLVYPILNQQMESTNATWSYLVVSRSPLHLILSLICYFYPLIYFKFVFFLFNKRF